MECSKRGWRDVLELDGTVDEPCVRRLLTSWLACVEVARGKDTSMHVEVEDDTFEEAEAEGASEEMIDVSK